jgi:hypothetical protein
MRQDYPQWLAEQQYSENTQTAQIHRIKKVEEYYGDLANHFSKGSYQDIIDTLTYSTQDERNNRPNPSKINFTGNTRNNLQSYKNAVVRYRKFLRDDNFSATPFENGSINNKEDTYSAQGAEQQRFSLERDMQAALRRNIASLDPTLRIADVGAERAVDSGFIDITCDDGGSLVIVELKAGKADSRAIGQILGYMGDLQNEEGNRTVRGILVAHSFDKRTKAAARAVPSLTLKTYSIEFQFINEP